MVRNELIKTYLFAVSAGFSRIAEVALPMVDRSVKFVSVSPESKIVAVLDLRSKPRKPSSSPVYDDLVR